MRQTVYVSTGITVYFTKDSGQNWQRMSTSSAPFYYGLWGSTANDIYAVGSSGAIYHYPWSESPGIPGASV